MAYLQITTRCNMTCSHCCFSATSQGENMSREVFIAALQLAASRGDYLTIGGGEPTVHPEFMEYLNKALEFVNRGDIECNILVITNGKLKGKALKMIDMVEDGAYLDVELSQDDYHDPIKPEVVAAFRSHSRGHMIYGHTLGGVVGVRTPRDGQVLARGRAADPARGLPIVKDHNQCCCQDYLVDPAGDVWSCGCKAKKLGNVLTDPGLDGWDMDDPCAGNI